MNSFIEEGVVNMSTYAENLKINMEVKAGFITAIPPNPFHDKRRHWTDIGFMSRALPVSFDYQVSTRIKILDFIKNQEHLGQALETFNLPKETKSIGLSYKMAQRIEPYSMLLAAASKAYGFRYQRQLQTFAKAIALLQGKDQVDEECIREVERLANYINLDGHKI